MNNENTTMAIGYIIYLIIALIFIITIIAIINYTLYSVYSINAIRKEYTYNNSPFFKLNTIYNYMLINYVYLLNKNKDIRYKRTNEYCIYKDGNFVIVHEKDYGKNFYDENNNNDFRDIIYHNDYSYIEKQIKKNEDDTYVYIKSPVDKNIEVTVKDKDGNNVKDKDGNDVKEKKIIYCKYEKINEDLGFFENISRYLWEFFSSFSLYDDKATYLYVHLNNRYYEMIIFVIFIIIFIFIIKVIITITSNLLSTISDKNISEEESIFRHIYNKKISAIIIIIFVLLYCMLHSTLYKKIFIENVYDRIYKMYNEILKIDLHVQSEFSEIILFYNKNNSKSEIQKLKEKTIDNLKYLSHNGNLDKRDTIVNFDDQTNDAETQIDLFTKKILLVNKKFNVGNHTKLYNLKEYIEECINYHCSNVSVCFGASSDTIADEGAKTTTMREVEHVDRLLASQLFIIMVYMYVINNNKEDPYIILKLNKLILGDILKVGDKNIDKDIEYTLTLRSLLYEKLDITDAQNQLNNIRDAIKNQILKKYVDNKGKNYDLVYENVIDLINIKIKTFVENVENANNNLNFFMPVYFFNLYLALEIGVNFIVILIILYAMLYYDESTPELKEKIKETIEWIKVAKDEIETAIYGVI